MKSNELGSNKFFNESTNSKQFYKPNSIDSGIKWRLFLAETMKFCVLDNEISNLSQQWSDWGRIIKQKITGIIKSSWTKFFEEEFQSIDFNFMSPQGEANQRVIETIAKTGPCKSDLRITTIHKIKGETLDAVMLVSNHNKHGDGGHWTKWLEDKKSEHARFAYVASSRPQFLLVWAVNKKDNASEQLEKLGFVNYKYLEEK